MIITITCSGVFMVYWLPWSLSSIEERIEEIKSDTKAYLSLMELGEVLEEISSACPCEYYCEHTLVHVYEWCVCVCVAPVQNRRPFPEKVLKAGEPNLVVTFPGEPHYDTVPSISKSFLPPVQTMS